MLIKGTLVDTIDGFDGKFVESLDGVAIVGVIVLLVTSLVGIFEGEEDETKSYGVCPT